MYKEIRKLFVEHSICCQYKNVQKTKFGRLSSVEKYYVLPFEMFTLLNWIFIFVHKIVQKLVCSKIADV